MRCQFCGSTESKVLDSRSTDDNNSIRRRRECLACGKRFTTFETIETTPILVVKNDGSRQTFDTNKIKRGIIRACEKRPVSMGQIDKIVEDIQKEISNSLEQEIKSSEIGELIMRHLQKVDDVAYIRFASVYRKFADLTHFKEFLQNIDVNVIEDKSKKKTNE